MRLPHNVEKSGFRRGEYVAYGPTCTYRVKRLAPGLSWLCSPHRWHGDVAPSQIIAKTLSRVGELVK